MPRNFFLVTCLILNLLGSSSISWGTLKNAIVSFSLSSVGFGKNDQQTFSKCLVKIIFSFLLLGHSSFLLYMGEVMLEGDLSSVQFSRTVISVGIKFLRYFLKTKSNVFGYQLLKIFLARGCNVVLNITFSKGIQMWRYSSSCWEKKRFFRTHTLSQQNKGDVQM